MNGINVLSTKFSIDHIYTTSQWNKYFLRYGFTKTHDIKADKTFETI